MTQAKRITIEEALGVMGILKLTAHHVLVIGDKRFQTEQRDKHWHWWFGSDPGEFVTSDQLEPMLKLGVAHVELEPPSPFDAPEFEGWVMDEKNHSGHEYRLRKISDGVYFKVYDDGQIWSDGSKFTQVPIDRIPEAARHINALLALGDGK